MQSLTSSNWGKYANNVATLCIVLPNDNMNTDMVEDADGNSGELSFRNISVPNIANFPHKGRCMVMLKHLSIGQYLPSEYSSNDNWDKEDLFDAPFVSVNIEGLGVMNSYDNVFNQNSAIGYGTIKSHQVIDNLTNYANYFLETDCTNILEDGVLCSSPFGKSFTININDVGGGGRPVRVMTLTKDNTDAVIVLKILFLDNEDMKQV